MFKEDNLDEKIEKNDSKIKEISIQIQNLNREEKALLDELKVTPEQLSTFIENKENFSEKNWDEIQSQKKKLDQKLLLELANIRNPSKTKKAFKERNIDNNWLFVK